MAQREVTWDALAPLVAEGWTAIFRHFEASRVLWSGAQHEAGYSIEAVGFLPAVLVLPLEWRGVLPPLDACWVIPSRQG